jgi:hypothetical protein
LDLTYDARHFPRCELVLDSAGGSWEKTGQGEVSTLPLRLICWTSRNSSQPWSRPVSGYVSPQPVTAQSVFRGPIDAVVGHAWRHRIGIQPGYREALRIPGAGAGWVRSNWSAGAQIGRNRLIPRSGRHARADADPKLADLSTGRSVANGLAALGPGSVQEVTPARSSLTGPPI